MKNLILLIVLILTIGCSKSAENPAEINSVPQTISTSLIAKGSLMGSENISQQNVVFYNTATWNSILNSIDTFRLAQFTETTNIDFSLFQLIAVFDNVYGSPTYNINIVSVIENANNIIVTVQKVYEPSAASVMDQKFHIVKIPKSIKPVVFQIQ